MSILSKFIQLFKKETSEESKNITVYEAYGINEYSDSTSKKTKYLEEMRGWVGSCVSAISDEVASIKIKL